MGQRADVGAFAAPHADADAGKVVLQQFKFVDVDRRLAHRDLLAGAGQLVGARAVDLLGRVDGRLLKPLARERREGCEDLFARDMFGGEGAVDGVFEVVAGGRGAQHHVGDVLLLLGLQRIDHLGGAADADQQDAGGERIERAGVADLDFPVAEAAQREFDFADHIGRGPAQGLVQYGDITLFEVETPQVDRFFH